MAVVSEKTFQELEVDQVLAQVSAHARSALGAEHVRALRPVGDREAAGRELGAVDQMVDLLGECPELSFPTALTHAFVRLASKEGATLDAVSLVQLSGTYDAVARARGLVGGLEGNYPIVREAVLALPHHPQLHATLLRVFDERGEMRDGASDQLKVLREAERGHKRRIEKSLERLVTDTSSAQHLSETYYTTLGERYVVLVKVDHKGRIPGIVHGESSSGLSLYVEPFVIHEANNALVEARLEAAREVRRILRELSETVYAHRADYPALIDGLAWLESLGARARWARETRSSRPEFSPGLGMRLRQARHPLLGQGAVAVDLELVEGDRVVVISGVNAGGKTVTLKLVGLLASLAQSGLFVPAAGGTTLPVFDTIASEIGDQQSLAANLSSFSSHVTHIGQVMRALGSRSLCLFDEFMTGTDPDEGAALGESILLELAGREALTLVTTHYGALKLLAKKHAGFKNVAVEFDLATLSPTYRLLADVPGTSLGIDIAMRFGIERGVGDRARSLLSRSQEAMTQMVQDLSTALAAAERERVHYETEASRAHEAREALESRLAQLEEHARQTVRKIKEDHAQELSRLKGEVLATLREQARPDPALPARLHARMLDVEKEADRLAPPPAEVAVGDAVRIIGMRDPGIVCEINAARGTAVVQVGPVTVRTELASLERAAAEGPAKTQGAPVGRTGPERSAQGGGRAGAGAPAPARAGGTFERRGPALPAKGGKAAGAGKAGGGGALTGHAQGRTQVDLGDTAIPTELMLIGKRVEEALEALEEYVDRAYARGYKEVRIVHGYGTGALRQAVARYLGSSPLVSGHRPGGASEGGAGATVATLKER